MHLRADETSAIACGGVLAVAIRRLQQIFDGVRQLSGGASREAWDIEADTAGGDR